MFKYVIQKNGDLYAFGRVLHVTRKGNYCVQFVNMLGEFMTHLDGTPMYERIPKEKLTVLSKPTWDALYKVRTKSDPPKEQIMQLTEVQERLKNAFDTVSETPDATFMARLNKTDYPTRNAAVADIMKRLHDVFPEASVQSHGSVGRPVLQWYIEFTL